MDIKQILDSSRVRLETLRGEPIAFRQQAVTASNGLTVIWTGADMDYYEELCQMQGRMDQKTVTEPVSEAACVR